jgi:hypothetical protein
VGHAPLGVENRLDTREERLDTSSVHLLPEIHVRGQHPLAGCNFLADRELLDRAGLI